MAQTVSSGGEGEKKGNKDNKNQAICKETFQVEKGRFVRFFCGAVNVLIPAVGSHTNLFFKFYSQEVGKSQLPKEDRSGLKARNMLFWSQKIQWQRTPSETFPSALACAKCKLKFASI